MPIISQRNSAAQTLVRISTPVSSNGSGFFMYARRRFKSHVFQSAGSFISKNSCTKPCNGSSQLSLNCCCRFLAASSRLSDKANFSPSLYRCTASAHNWLRSACKAARKSGYFLYLASTSITQKRRFPVSPFKKYVSLVVPQKTHCLGWDSITLPYAGRYISF